MGGAVPTSATAVPTGFTDTLVASVGSPTDLAFTPDGRLLVATQFGDLRVVQNGTLLPAPAVDLGSVLCTADEEGLLGVTVDPSFASNGFVYVYYTRNKSGTCVNRVSRFTMSGNTISMASELVLVDEIPATGNHNAGDLHFGNDGYLYISVGDGGCDYAGDSGCAGANDASRDQHALVGKILRITSTGGIPPSNPFQGAGTARCNVTGRTTAGNKCQETFAWGLRNPFRFAFDPNTTATRFFINDVGQGAWEEVDLGVAGADYGWNVREGPCVNGSLTNCGAPPAGMTNPVYSYSHPESGCAAITGGAFVPNGVWPSSYDGTYLYGDYTCGKIFVLTPNGSGGYTRSEFTNDVGAVVNMTFGPSPQGQGLYYTNYSDGGEVRLLESTAPGNRPPTARMTASPTSGPVPLAVSFNGSASTDPDAGDTLTYIWNFGDGSPPQTTSSATTSHTYTTAGTFTATLTVRDNDGAQSSPVSALIDAGNTAPQVTIDTPTTAARFAVGQTITLHGTATDAEDGALPASSLSWLVLRHHDTHTHPVPRADCRERRADHAAVSRGSRFRDRRLPRDPADGHRFARGQDHRDAERPAQEGGSHLRHEPCRPERRPRGYDVHRAEDAHVVGGVFVRGRCSDADGRIRYDLELPVVVRRRGGRALDCHACESDHLHGDVRAGREPGSSRRTGSTRARVRVWRMLRGGGMWGRSPEPSWNAGGRFGSALSFDGVNDWVSVPDANSLDLTTGMTLEAWVRPTALGGWRTVIFKERPGGVVYGLFADQAGSRPSGQVFIGSERNAVGTAALPLNAWTHLATTYDGAVVRLYVNGVLAGSTSVTGAMAASTGVLRVGGNSIWGEWFAGLIDEVRVYNRALSAGEVQQDMATAVSGSPPPPDTSPPSAPSGSERFDRGRLGDVRVGRLRATTWVLRATTCTARRRRASRRRLGTGSLSRLGRATRDSGLAAGTYYYRVTAEDAAGNISAPSPQLTAVVPADQPPTVSVTAPAAGATVSGTVTVSAAASDDVGVAGVQFRLGAANLGRRGHLVAVLDLLGHDDRQQRQLPTDRRRPRQRLPDHHLHGDHRHRQQLGRAAAGPGPGRGVRV